MLPGKSYHLDFPRVICYLSFCSILLSDQLAEILKKYILSNPDID
jgi:hypothetical protein